MNFLIAGLVLLLSVGVNNCCKQQPPPPEKKLGLSIKCARDYEIIRVHKGSDSDSDDRRHKRDGHRHRHKKTKRLLYYAVRLLDYSKTEAKFANCTCGKDGKCTTYKTLKWENGDVRCTQDYYHDPCNKCRCHKGHGHHHHHHHHHHQHDHHCGHRHCFFKWDDELAEDNNNIDECASSPCKNSGTCLDQVKGYTCSCEAGWNGKTCEKNIDECASSPCKNSGTCLDKVNGYTCSCNAGWDGKNCEKNIDECASSPCENGGTCLDKLNGYHCSCKAGWKGITCEKKDSNSDKNDRDGP